MKKLILWVKILCLNVLLLGVVGSIIMVIIGWISLGALACVVQLVLIWQIMGRQSFWKKNRGQDVTLSAHGASLT